MKRVKLEEFTEFTFKQAGVDKALLAIGSTESHGEHLPFAATRLSPTTSPSKSPGASSAPWWSLRCGTA